MKKTISLMAGIFMIAAALTVGAEEKKAAQPSTEKKAVTLELTREGKPAATIVLAEKPTRSAQLAAAELREHVRVISGATLPVTNDAAEVKGARILVGESKATQALGLKSADFKPQEYLVRFAPDLLVLMGRDKEDYGKLDYASSEGATLPDLYDDHATCYAVYDFLERQCGVRWYLPTELGLVYDAQPTLKVSGAERRRTPGMEYRAAYIDRIEFARSTGYYKFPADFIGTQFGGQGWPLAMREHALFAHRMRVGGLRLTPGGHSHYDYHWRFSAQARDSKNKYFESYRPELFAQGYKPVPDTHLCWTSQEVVDQTVKDIQAYFKLPDHSKEQNPEIHKYNWGDTYYGLGAMDTPYFCKCPRCSAIIRKNQPPGSDSYDKDSTSDYWFQFVNRVAKEIQKTNPDKKLITLAYNQYKHPPSFKVEPNVGIVQVLNGRRRPWHTAEYAEYWKMMDEWHKESNGARPSYVWTHDLFPALTHSYPFPGFFAHTVVEQMEKFRKYGIRGFYLQTSESSWATQAQHLFLWDQLELQLSWRLAVDPDLDGNKLIDEFFARYYGAAAKPMQAFYELVEKTYCDPASYPAEVQRAEEIEQNPFIAWECLGTAERMEKLGKLMDEAKAACRTDMEKKRVELFDKGIWQPMRKGKEAYEVQRAKAMATMQSALAPCVAAPPEGDPRKLDWAKAGALKNWSSNLGKPTTRKIEARIAHDGQNLYLSLQENTDTSKLVRDAPKAWDGDSWEVFVARRNNLGETCRQLVADANGKSADLSYNVHDKALEREAGAKVYSDTSAADCWRVYLAIPLDRLLAGGAVARPGESVALNIVRATRGSVENAAMWVPTMTAAFREPDRMGRVALLPAGAQGLNLFKEPGFEEAVPLKDADWAQKARAAKVELSDEWCMAWVPGAGFGAEGQALKIVKGEPGKEVHSGSRALYIKGNSEFHITNGGARGQPGGTYKFRFFAKGKGKLAAHTYQHVPGNMSHGLILPGEFHLTAEWKEYVGTYTPSADQASQGWVFYMGVYPGTEATVDDFEMWKE